MRRNRWTQTGLCLIVIASGLGSRRSEIPLPDVLRAYAGDTLWALLVYLAVGWLRPSLSIPKCAGLSGAFALLVELSQLYHADWIDALRATRLGGLILGFQFVWSDLVCYALGVALGVALDTVRDRAARSRSALRE